MNYRPYWAKRPKRRRAFCAFLLITMPLWFIPAVAWGLRQEIAEAWVDVTRELKEGVRP